MIYIDAEYKCHTSNQNGDFREVQTDVFDGKCDAFVEGYRYVPSGESWVREDGQVFAGEMTAPWKPWSELDAAQREYERQLAETLSAENAALISDMAQMVEEVYSSDMEMMGL